MPDCTCLECGEPIEEVPGIYMDGTPISQRWWYEPYRPYNRLCIDCRIDAHPRPKDRDELYEMSDGFRDILNDIRKEKEEQDMRSETDE